MKIRHPSSSLISRRRLLAVGAGTAALSLLGCGGDDGGGGGFAGVGSGGTGSFSSGAIRGFGSILVGDIHYDESGAAIFDDAGDALDRAALRLGMVVDVSGAPVTAPGGGRRRAAADTVAVRSEIEGPISAIDRADRRLTVLGQQVRITPATVFDDALPGGFDALAPDQLVEISGFLQENGRYTATRIALADDDITRYKLRGVASDADASARTLRLGQALISWSDVSPRGGTVANGRFVRIELQPQAGANGTWRALDVQVLAAAPSLQPGDGDEVELEGYVASVAGADRRFIMLGVTVDYSQARFDDGQASDLAPGVRVEVEGRMSADGTVLIASEVEFEDDDDDEFQVEGAISSIAPASSTLVLRGVTVDYSQARFDGGTADHLAPGVRIEVEGRLSPDGTVLVADEIEFDDDRDDEREVEGAITSVSAADRTFVVAGITVDYSHAHFHDGTAADLAPGVQVEVEGYMSPDRPVLVANEIEFDD